MLSLVKETCAEGARLDAVCDRLSLSARTVQRWLRPETAEDRRCGPRQSPPNRLTDAERDRLVEVANSDRFRDASPKQIVPALADEGTYLASESSIYRELRRRQLMQHRGKARAPTARPKPHFEATAPLQVWTWDITYLRSNVKGVFFYLYLVVDVYSRRITGWDVHPEESSELASALMRRALAEAGNPVGLTTHSDNGAPMKGNTLLATLKALGVVTSFSRPRVSDDNPFSEALFRTLKYRPAFPSGPFDSIEAARAWVASFVGWYNTQHRHSGIRFVTPDERHYGREAELLSRRHALYQRARQRHPARWTRNTRNWAPAGPVRLNPAATAEGKEEPVRTLADLSSAAPCPNVSSEPSRGRTPTPAHTERVRQKGGSSARTAIISYTPRSARRPAASDPVSREEKRTEVT